MRLFRRDNIFEDYGYGLEAGGGKVYRTINGISILLMFLFAGLLVLAATGTFLMSAGLFGFVIMMLIICVALLMSLYWIRRIEQQEFKIVAIVFLSLIGLCALLWIICVWLGVSIFNDAVADREANPNKYIAIIKFIQITIVFTIQFAVASFVGKGVTKFRKTMLPFQVIAYISYLFFDFYITFFFCCFQFNTKDVVNINTDALSLLGDRVMLTFFILAVVYVGISKSIISGAEKRRLRNMVADDIAKESNSAKSEKKSDETPAEKLEKLKQLYDQNLITQEEYDQKKAEILKDM